VKMMMPPCHPSNHQIELQLLKAHPVLLLRVPIWALLLTIQMFFPRTHPPTHTHTQSAHAHLHGFGPFSSPTIVKVEEN
jgi:hypothetical protein